MFYFVYELQILREPTIKAIFYTGEGFAIYENIRSLLWYNNPYMVNRGDAS